MKTLRLALAIFFAVIPAASFFVFDAGAALAADSSCECMCAAAKESLKSTSSTTYGTGMVYTDTKTGAPLDVGTVADRAACNKKCTDPAQVAIPTGADKVIDVDCVQAGCWCKGKDGPYLKGQASQDGCKKMCTDNKEEFVSWGNTPPVKSTGTDQKCPPGGTWDAASCAAAVNNDGVKIGKWDPPAGVDKGPYCYYNDTPIKLGVAIGGLTSSTLAQYLTTFYRLGLGIAAVVAVLFIMIGGFRYMSAAGGGGVDAGKDMIKNAVVGLILAALSYTLLQTVNPDILKLRLPRVNLIKQCAYQLDCGTRADQATCEDNSKDPSKRCIWNTKQAICYDNSVNQSDALGKSGGECKRDGNTENFTCSSGQCVKINSTTYKCSDGGRCAPCTSDTKLGEDGKPLPNSDGGQCAPDPSTGLPVMCIDNQCAMVNPNKLPTLKSYSRENYILCTNSQCSSDKDCAGGNAVCGSAHTCKASNKGSLCTDDSDCRVADGFKCTAMGTKKACCPNGDPTNCMGCASNDDCPGVDSTGHRAFFCPSSEALTQAGKDWLTSRGADLSLCQARLANNTECINGFDSMCLSGRCLMGNSGIGGVCGGEGGVVNCTTDSNCQIDQKMGPGSFCSDNRFWSEANSANPNYGKTGVCVTKSGKGVACCGDAECLSGNCSRSGTAANGSNSCGINVIAPPGKCN